MSGQTLLTSDPIHYRYCTRRIVRVWWGGGVVQWLTNGKKGRPPIVYIRMFLSNGAAPCLYCCCALRTAAAASATVGVSSASFLFGLFAIAALPPTAPLPSYDNKMPLRRQRSKRRSSWLLGKSGVDKKYSRRRGLVENKVTAPRSLSL